MSTPNGHPLRAHPRWQTCAWCKARTGADEPSASDLDALLPAGARSDRMFPTMTPQWTGPEESARVRDALPVGTRVVVDVAGRGPVGAEVVGHRYLRSETHFVDVQRDSDDYPVSAYPSDIVSAVAAATDA
ncbi:MAG: hypothetical protein ACSLE6_12205 [Mycobacterium sp.]